MNTCHGTLWIALALFAAGACGGNAADASNAESPLIADAVSMIRRPDGNWDIVCRGQNGAPTYSQLATDAEVSQGAVCNRTSIAWTDQRAHQWTGVFTFAHVPMDDLAAATTIWGLVFEQDATHVATLNENGELWGKRMLVDGMAQSRGVKIADHYPTGVRFIAFFGTWQDCYQLTGPAQEMCLQDF
jgi:hypothetical protein